MAKTSEFLLIIMVILAMTSGRSVTNNRAGIAEAWALAKFDVGLTPQAERARGRADDFVRANESIVISGQGEKKMLARVLISDWRSSLSSCVR